MEKALADYREQLNRPFEHEERLRELCARQQEINLQLDLDKSDTQVVANDNMQQDEQAADSFVEWLATRWRGRGQVNDLEAWIDPLRRPWQCFSYLELIELRI